MDNTQNIISFCSGYGGLDRGLELAGVETRVVCHVEIEAYAIANLVAKMETGLLVPAPVWTNLKTFPMDAFRGRIHGITAGYPCQPFSVAGQRKGTDDPRHLWPYIRKIYRTICPQWMFFENVEGHVTLGLSTVISDLEEDGYRVKAGLFTAAEVGAPHRRKRVFILANASWVGWRRRSESWGEVRGSRMSEDKVKGSGSSQEVMGNSSSVRCSGLREVRGEVSSDTNGEECGVHEFKGTGTLPGHESQNIVADTNFLRPQGKRPDSHATGREGQDERSDRLCYGTKWPARPGQPQYDWEEPRVVESGLGRATDGTSSRVDRLRLLGNGVVPQQAAKAYLTLKQEERT